MVNGEITILEYAECLSKHIDDMEDCTAECICEQPGCNCTPPENTQDQTEVIDRYELRDMIITCYPESK